MEEQSHPHLFMHCLWLLFLYNGGVLTERPHGSQRWKYFLYDNLQWCSLTFSFGEGYCKDKEGLVQELKAEPIWRAMWRECSVRSGEWETMLWSVRSQGGDKQTEFYSTWGMKTCLFVCFFILRVKWFIDYFWNADHILEMCFRR